MEPIGVPRGGVSNMKRRTSLPRVGVLGIAPSGGRPIEAHLRDTARSDGRFRARWPASRRDRTAGRTSRTRPQPRRPRSPTTPAVMRWFRRLRSATAQHALEPIDRRGHAATSRSMIVLQVTHLGLPAGHVTRRVLDGGARGRKMRRSRAPGPPHQSQGRATRRGSPLPTGRGGAVRALAGRHGSPSRIR